MTFKNSQQAFEEAINSGRLSASPLGAYYAGNFMYMGTDPSGRDLFKNILSREYLA